MTEYVVSASRFYRDPDSVSNDFYAEYPHGDRSRCRPAMTQLVMRYGLANKSVLSIGAGAAHEEATLAEHGCTLTLVDIDEHGLVEPYLRTCGGSAGPKLRYVIGDAMAHLRDDSTQHDAIYVSGFTPEEIRRGEIQAAFERRLSTRVAKLVLRRIAHRLPTWPMFGNPFGPYLVEAVQRRLRPGGLLISQSFYRGVPLDQNPHYPYCIRAQLRRLGVELLAYYVFAPPWTGVGLTVAYKGSRVEARDFLAGTAAPELTTFHGRSTVGDKITVTRFV